MRRDQPASQSVSEALNLPGYCSGVCSQVSSSELGSVMGSLPPGTSRPHSRSWCHHRPSSITIDHTASTLASMGID